MNIDKLYDEGAVERVLEKYRDSYEEDPPAVSDVVEGLEQVQETILVNYRHNAYPEEQDANIFYETWKFVVFTDLEDCRNPGLDQMFEYAGIIEPEIKTAIGQVFKEIIEEHLESTPESEFIVLRKPESWRAGEGWMTGRLRYLTEEGDISAEQALDYYFVEVIGRDPEILAENRGKTTKSVMKNTNTVVDRLNES